MVPYIQLVFGLECALRSIRSLPFQARGKYDVTICLVVVVLMLIGTWLPSFFVHSNVCFASLVWYVARYGFLGLKLLIIAGSLMILAAIIIFVRLSTVSLIDEHQRIAASRMVYYLVLGIVSLVSLPQVREYTEANYIRPLSFHTLDLWSEHRVISNSP